MNMNLKKATSKTTRREFQVVEFHPRLKNFRERINYQPSTWKKRKSKAYRPRITYLPPLLNFFITSRASLECICHGRRGRFKSNLNSSIRLVPKLAPTTTPTKITGKICGGLVTRFRHFEYTTWGLCPCTYREVVPVVEDKKEAVGVTDGRKM